MVFTQSNEMIDYINKILQGDCLTVLPTLPEKSIHCCITSPPYWGLRSYHGIPATSWLQVDYSLFGMPISIGPMTCELGHERDPKEFIAHMVLIFREVKRVLRDDGTCWVNMGDSYAGYWGEKYAHKPFGEDRTPDASTVHNKPSPDFKNNYYKPKDMMGIPFMLAFALRDDGWYLRSDIIFSKANCMPESVTDRPTKSHEYIFLLAKSDKYFYDAEAIKTEPKYPDVIKYAWGRAIDGSPTDARAGTGEERRVAVRDKFHGNKPRPGVGTKGGNQGKQRGHENRRYDGFNDRYDEKQSEDPIRGVNKRTVWHISTVGYPGAHFATFSEELVRDPVKAGTSEYGCCSECGAPYKREVDRELVPGPKAAKNFVVDKRDEDADDGDQGSNRQKDGHKNGWLYESKTTGWKAQCTCNASVVPCTVLDPFSGAGTTFMVAHKLNRRAVGIEISPVYVPMSEKRINDELGMFSPLK